MLTAHVGNGNKFCLVTIGGTYHHKQHQKTTHHSLTEIAIGGAWHTDCDLFPIIHLGANDEVSYADILVHFGVSCCD